MSDLEQLESGLKSADPDEIQDIVAAALRLERAMYSGEDNGPYLFWLRKTLEGVFGQDLPRLDEFGKAL